METGFRNRIFSRCQGCDEEVPVKPSESSDRVKSFEDLKALLEKKAIPLPAKPAAASRKETVQSERPKTEQQLFAEAMADVTPLPKTGRFVYPPQNRTPMEMDNDPDATTLEALEELVRHGKGFIVAQTPEYIEGKSDRVHPSVLERLHRGDFSIQAYIDLHGMTVESAQGAFEKFLKTSILRGRHAVLIVHGRGLSSPAKPVLKTKVYEWLTSGPWRKWVIAFSSARRCDGGAGATYVLLRHRPLAKRLRKKKCRMQQQ